MRIRPVGVIKSEIKEPRLVVKERDLCLDWQGILEDAKKIRNVISEILIYDEFTGILDGIEDFSHILVIYWCHFTSEEDRSLIKVHPIGRKDLPEIGIFSSWSPARPNPICVSAVPLLEREGNVLKVKDLDAVDGSPVVDIKPYYPGYYSFSDAKISWWLKEVERQFAEALRDK
jgi:tRNA-Thr(GGU) m(6)t(6)A37 methyltransferase TsaA